MEYLVKWRGVDHTQDSWVTETELGDRYQHLIDAFTAKKEEQAEQALQAAEEEERRGKKRPAEELVRRLNFTFIYPFLTLISQRTSAPGKKPRVDKVMSGEIASFAQGDKVQEIVGARMIDGILYLYVHWYPFTLLQIH